MILGIDSSTKQIGLCIINDNGSELIHNEVILADDKAELFDRVKQMIVEFNKRYTVLQKVNMVYIEKPATKLSFKTLFALSIICGAIYTIITLNNSMANIEFVAAVTAKKKATGSGRASKQQVIESIEQRFGVRLVNDNMADAIAVALCGIKGE
jgi:Holliday junction resolvasome RuvABC endonuclease subunit